jgi:FAD/FMN-containing dehydrogenase
LQGIQIQEYFRPKGCQFSIDGPSITFGAGNEMGALNAAASLQNLTILSGGQDSVNYGGYASGAGHGALSATYGLAADNVLEMEVVTPGGEILTINECQNQDLFWANRGVSY